MAENKEQAPAFTKEQLVQSERYADRQDLLNAVLEGDKTYTIEQTDKTMNDYLKAEVK